jgi:hypothetical protein
MLLDTTEQATIPTATALTAVTASAEDILATAVKPTKADPDSQYELSPQQFVYVVLTSIFVTCLIIADVIGVKLFEIPLPFEILGHKTVEHTCGMLIFPVTFVLGDVINEYFGPKVTLLCPPSCGPSSRPFSCSSHFPYFLDTSATLTYRVHWYPR